MLETEEESIRFDHWKPLGWEEQFYKLVHRASIQTTRVAIETRGFTYVTSGRKRESLKGDATFAFYDHLDGLEQFEGIQANVFTEVSTSKEKNFPAMNFIDRPV